MTVRTLSPMAPRCTGTCGAFATSPPSASKTAQEKSRRDRKSTRLNSSHANISYAVFCLKKIGEHTLREPDLMLAGRIAANNGDRLVAQTLNARVERGTWRVAIHFLPYPVDADLATLEDE